MAETRYAEGTEVPVERSRAEIERIITRFKADAFQFTSDRSKGYSAILFRSHNRHVKFVVALPTDKDLPPRRRSQNELQNALDAEERRRWRCLVLVLKAKLEAVKTGIATFEGEFLAHVLLPDGRTMAEWAAPQLETAYETGRMPDVFVMPSNGPQLGPAPRDPSQPIDGEFVS